MQSTPVAGGVGSGVVSTVRNNDKYFNVTALSLIHCKKLQRILQSFTVKFYSERLFPQFIVNCCYFLHLLPSNIVFFTV